MNELREPLETIKNEAENSVLDEERQRALDDVKADMEIILDDSDDNPVSRLIERIDTSLVLFDDEHPQIAQALRTAMDILVASGI